MAFLGILLLTIANSGFWTDARDPEGTRCRAVEQYLKKEAPHKHLVFILNKVDLVPTRVAVSVYCSFSFLPPCPKAFVRVLLCFNAST